MRIGNIVADKRDGKLLGEVISIDDYDRALIKPQNEAERELLIDLCYLKTVKEAVEDG